MSADLTRYSKLLSYVLRHRPDAVGIELDPAGWVEVEILLPALRSQRPDFTKALLERVVAENDKRRFEFSPDGSRIRASQGHSIGIDLGLEPVAPPPRLFHGTATRHLRSIRAQGLLAGTRDHVHLSADAGAARQVGSRHGRPVVLGIRADAMHADGFAFHVSANGVWLTATVPPRYLAFPDNDAVPGSKASPRRSP